jgi:hypothetical protein
LKDGFSLNECYAAPAVLAGVAAHLLVHRPLARGLLRGLAFGVAISIKQSALAVVAACLIEGVVRHARRGGWKEPAASASGTAAGLALGLLPAVAFLAARGWLGGYLNDLAEYTWVHAGRPLTTWPDWRAWIPLCVIAWWIIAALAARPPRPLRGPARSTDRPGLAFLLIWIALEVAAATGMREPRHHYWIMVAGPACLLGAAALGAWQRAMQAAPLSHQPSARLWMLAGSALLLGWSLLPLVSQAVDRGDRLSVAQEQARFARWQEHWRLQPIGPYFKEVLDGS